MIIRSLPLLAAAAALFAALPAAAAPATDDAPRTVVRTDDLDLTRDRGVRILYQRIQFAAQALCPASARDPARASRASVCRAAVIDRAVAGAGVPRLMALHRELGGRGTERVASR